MMTAHKYELDNFIMILDNNGLQLDGPSEVIMPLIDVNRKAEAFGFEKSPAGIRRAVSG